MIRLSSLAAVLMLLAVVPGCRKTEDSAKPTIAFVMKTLNNPFFIDMQRGAEAAAKRLGVELIVQAADREVDVEKQMQIIENLIQRKVSALCITPSGSREIVPAIRKANEANIPVLVVDTRVDESALREAGARTLTFIGSDNREGGRIAGEFLVSALKGKGNIAILEGIPGHETGDERLEGLRSVLSAAKGITIVASQTANWERDQGFTVFQNILQAHPDVQALFACNDMMALGALEAIAASRGTQKPMVVGFDAVEDARAAILKGDMSGSVAQHPEEMGRIAVESAFNSLRGETLPSEIPVKIELITKATLIAAGTSH